MDWKIVHSRLLLDCLFKSNSFFPPHVSRGPVVNPAPRGGSSLSILVSWLCLQHPEKSSHLNNPLQPSSANFSARRYAVVPLKSFWIIAFNKKTDINSIKNHRNRERDDSFNNSSSFNYSIDVQWQCESQSTETHLLILIWRTSQVL